VEELPVSAFITPSRTDKPIVRAFLRVHIDILFSRSKANNDFQLTMHLLRANVNKIMEFQGCTIHDPVGQAYMVDISNYLATTAKRWTVDHLLRKHPVLLRGEKFLSHVCTAVIVGNVDAVAAYLKGPWAALSFREAWFKGVNSSGDCAFEQPLFVAIATGKIRILSCLLALYIGPWERCWWFLDRSIPVYQAFRLAIIKKQPRAIDLLHGIIVHHEEWRPSESQCYDLLELAANVEDIVAFRTVIHLAALCLAQRPLDPIPLLETCEEAHEDVVWFMLKRAIYDLDNNVDPLKPAEEQNAVHLVSFIMAHYGVFFGENTTVTPTLVEAVASGNLRLVDYLLQRGDTFSNEDLWKVERWLRGVGYNVRVFEQCRNDATKLGHEKHTLIALYHVYKASNQHRGRTKTRLQRLVKHVERSHDAQLKTRVKQWAKSKNISRGTDWLEKAKRIASNQPVTAIPHGGSTFTALACGARGYRSS
jgi:hypothetical protein